MFFISHLLVIAFGFGYLIIAGFDHDSNKLLIACESDPSMAYPTWKCTTTMIAFIMGNVTILESGFVLYRYSFYHSTVLVVLLLFVVL